MKIESIQQQVFKTSNGRVFADWVEACDHERDQAIKKFLHSLPGLEGSEQSIILDFLTDDKHIHQIYTIYQHWWAAIGTQPIAGKRDFDSALLSDKKEKG